MANRLNAPNQFEALSPPWLLTSLDTNFTQNQSAWNDSSLGFVNGIPVDTGSANVYAVTLPFGSPSAYQDGMTVPFIPANTNTGASAITVSPLGSASILNPAGIALQGGELAANRATLLVYKSASPVGFRIIGPCGLSAAFAVSSASISVECAGYSSVGVSASSTITTGFTVNLNHLAQGVPVTILIVNNSGTTRNVAINANDPSGTSYAITVGVRAGSATGSTQVTLSSAGISLVGNQNYIFTGAAIGTNLILSL
jgi:hypothetical protein